MNAAIAFQRCFETEVFFPFQQISVAVLFSTRAARLFFILKEKNKDNYKLADYSMT